MTHAIYGLVFPGQGSQFVGMLDDIAKIHPSVLKTFATASDVLGYDLWRLTQAGPAEALDATIHTQPALLTASYAIWQILQDILPEPPVLLAGHSLGEYTALVCAEALSFTDAVRLVAARGQYMQEAVVPGEGAMAAIIGLDEAIVASLCEKAREQDQMVAPANFNSPGQIVIAGHKPAVLRAMRFAKENGAKLVMLLPVSVPSHCELMLGAADRLAILLRQINWQPLTIPVINNVDVLPYTTADQICDGLKRQLYSPVRWVEVVQAFSKAHVTHLIECGPGKILTGLNKRIDKHLHCMTIADVL